MVDFAVALTRATREHRDVRMGSSVRGAIDLVLLLTGLAGLRGEHGMARASARDAAHAALSGRIRIADGCDRTPESVLDELLGGFWPAGSPAPTPDDWPAPPRRGRTGRPGGTLTACRRASGRRRGRPRVSGLGGAAATAPGRARPPGGPSAAPNWPPGTPPSLPCRPRSASWTPDVFAGLLAADPDTAVTAPGRPGPRHRP